MEYGCDAITRLRACTDVVPQSSPGPKEVMNPAMT